MRRTDFRGGVEDMKFARVAVVTLLVGLFSLGVLTGCGKASSPQQPTSQTKGPGDYKIVLILPGPINDQSWNATNYSGLTACNTSLGTKMEDVENVQAQNYESTFRNYGQRGYDLVIAAGTQFDDAAKKVAAVYPKTDYLVVNGDVSASPNLSSVTIREWESGYVSGVIAGYTTKSGIIGEIGGFPNAIMIDCLNGVTAGAKSVNPSFKKAIRAYANTWSDVAKVKELASSMISQGADTIFAYANQAGLGAIQACQDKKAKLIGFSSDQNSVAPGVVPASVVYDYGALYESFVKEFLGGTWKAEVVGAGIKEGVVNVIYTSSISQAVKDKVTQVENDIISGKIPKPATTAQ